MGETVQTVFIHLSFTLAALAFIFVLCIVVTVIEKDKKTGNRYFIGFIYTMMAGMVITCVDDAFRRHTIAPISPYLGMALYLLAFFTNIFLTFFFSRYTESFFPDKRRRLRIFSKFNALLMHLSLLACIICYCIKIPDLKGPDWSYFIPDWFVYVIGFYIEIYFLLYAVTVFALFGKELNRRAFVTAIAAFVVTIGGIAFEAFNSTPVMFNYFFSVLGLYIFYIGVETPDYKKLIQTMKELENARIKADEANRTKSEFLANMSHEIRTPINAVIGMNEMILRESTEPQITEYAHKIENSGKNLLSIINDILDIAKIESGRMELEKESYKFSSVLNDVVTMITFRAKSKNLEFNVDIDRTMPDNLYGDHARIGQILVNLLNNAVKYTDEGSVSLKISYSRSGNILKLIADVTDTGIGIKEEDIGKLFGKFNRVDTDRNRSIEGTGLGLAIVQSLLKLMGGNISIKSVYGKGSTFRAVIPQTVISNEQIGDYRVAYEKSKAEEPTHVCSLTAPEASILVVDDTPVNLFVVKGLLKDSGISIDTAGSGKEALVKTALRTYDLILMDIRMPVMSGVDALKLIRDQENGKNNDVPVICLTADAVTGAREQYLADGFIDYLTKPIDSSLLEELLKKYLPAEKVKERHV